MFGPKIFNYDHVKQRKAANPECVVVLVWTSDIVRATFVFKTLLTTHFLTLQKQYKVFTVVMPQPLLCKSMHTVCNGCTQTYTSASFHHRVIHLLKRRQSLMLPINLLSDWLDAIKRQDNQRSMKNLMLTRWHAANHGVCVCVEGGRTHSECLVALCEFTTVQSNLTVTGLRSAQTHAINLTHTLPCFQTPSVFSSLLWDRNRSARHNPIINRKVKSLDTLLDIINLFWESR